MANQAESLKQVAEATGEVSQLQDALNKNLTSLAGSAKHFEQTLHGLGAVTIHLLNARLKVESPAATVCSFDALLQRHGTPK